MEKELKDFKIHFLKKEIELADCEVIEEMNRLGLIKITSKRKGDKIMDKLKFSP